MTTRRAPLAALPVAAALLAAGCAGSGQKFEKDEHGRTILVESAPPAPAPEPPRNPARDVLLTKGDDARVGREGAASVEAQIGVLDDPALNDYVQALGEKLLRGVGTSFKFRFRVVDQVEANAFALPGGYIFVSRGLLALAQSEDQLANVIGHEITHVTRRHAATRQAIDRHQSRFTMGWVRATEGAAYSRDMERESDRGGQMLAGAAGYDPAAMSTFLASLGKAVRLSRGSPRYTSMLDSHPGTTERVALNAMHANEIRWARDPALGDTTRRYLEHIDGLPFGDRPEAGFFRGSRFLHPVLGFSLRFPDGWRTINTAGAVAALSPNREAQIFLSPERPAADPQAAAQRFLGELETQVPGVKVRSFEPVRLRGAPGALLELDVRGTYGLFVFFEFRGGLFRLTGATQTVLEGRYRPKMISTMRSFAPITGSQVGRIEIQRIRLAEARAGEDLVALCRRAGCAAASVAEVGVLNGVSGSDRFRGGELVKIIHTEPWSPPGR